MQIFFESKFEVIYLYEFETNANYFEDICSVSV